MYGFANKSTILLQGGINRIFPEVPGLYTSHDYITLK